MSCQIYTLILEVCLCSMKCSETRFHPALSYSDIVGLVLMVKNGSRADRSKHPLITAECDGRQASHIKSHVERNVQAQGPQNKEVDRCRRCASSRRANQANQRIDFGSWTGMTSLTAHTGGLDTMEPRDALRPSGRGAPLRTGPNRPAAVSRRPVPPAPPHPPWPAAPPSARPARQGGAPGSTWLPKASLAEAAARAPKAPAHRQLNTPQKRRRIAPAWRCRGNPAGLSGYTAMLPSATVPAAPTPAGPSARHDWTAASRDKAHVRGEAKSAPSKGLAGAGLGRGPRGLPG